VCGLPFLEIFRVRFDRVSRVYRAALGAGVDFAFITADHDCRNSPAAMFTRFKQRPRKGVYVTACNTGEASRQLLDSSWKWLAHGGCWRSPPRSLPSRTLATTTTSMKSDCASSVLNSASAAWRLRWAAAVCLLAAAVSFPSDQGVPCDAGPDRGGPHRSHRGWVVQHRHCGSDGCGAR
jgi:hypothetical protein